MRRRVDPEDVLQEACLAAFENFDQYDGSRPIFAWLSVIATNSLGKALDREKRRKRDFRTESDRGPDSAADRASPARHQLETEEVFEEVSRAIQRLPPCQQEALLLVRIGGTRVAEAAEILESSPNAISCNLVRALQSLLRVIVHDPDQFPYLTKLVLPRLLEILSAGRPPQEPIEGVGWDGPY